jgi:serine/threonine protein kinase
VAGSLRLSARWESPWKQYEKAYDLELAGSVEVAVRKAPPIELVHVRTFLKPGAEKALHMFQQLQHPNIVTALDVFTTDDGLYVVFEPMSISLERIVESPAYPNERQLAAILGQVSLPSQYECVS